MSAVAAAAGVPASSTSIAFVDALRHLGIRRVAVAASYPDDVAQHFVAFLTAGGVEVVSMGSHGIYTAAEVGTLDPDQVVAMVAAADHPDAEAVLVPDTAMHTLAIVDKLEAAVGKPVLTANQVTVWKGLELLGPVPPLPGLGTLFEDRRVTSFIGPLVQESTPSIIADKLRQAIGHGELKPGAQLGEAELARKLGVSRGPLREGMQRLTQEGLLVAIRNRGLFVIDMTPDDVRDMYLAREAIERAAARKILDGDHVAAGEELLRHRRADGRRPDTPAEVSELDIAFHERLVQLARSPRLSRMHQTFITETRMCIHALDQTLRHVRGPRRGAPRPGERDPRPATASSPTGC